MLYTFAADYFDILLMLERVRLMLEPISSLVIAIVNGAAYDFFVNLPFAGFPQNLLLRFLPSRG